MKKTSIVLGVLIVLVFSFGSLGVQNGYDLFQKALAKERAEGNLEEAIALYQQVIKDAKDESLSAKAQFRIGICYEKLGQKKTKQASAPKGSICSSPGISTVPWRRGSTKRSRNTLGAAPSVKRSLQRSRGNRRYISRQPKRPLSHKHSLT